MLRSDFDPWQTFRKVILVFGGAGGIGAEVATRLAAGGSRAVIADLNEAQAHAHAGRLLPEEDRLSGVACDITNPDLCDRGAQAAIDRFGRLDGVVNCAGISKPHDSISLDPADWARMVDIQLNGSFYVAQACARRMWDTGGAIVFITSINAEAAFPRRAAYCSSKAGVAMLTKVLAIEWAERRIRVNAVGPAHVATPMTQRNIAAGNVSETADQRPHPAWPAGAARRRGGRRRFLLSDQAGFITGHSLYVDGGWLAYGYF